MPPAGRRLSTLPRGSRPAQREARHPKRTHATPGRPGRLVAVGARDRAERPTLVDRSAQLELALRSGDVGLVRK
jgi:hypothetical protein